jgi:hypothetical protein
MPITVDGATPPSQSPLSGATPGLAVKDTLRRLSDNLGYQVTNSRFRAAAVTWIQDTLLEIQLADPKMQRTYVMDAAATLEAGTSDYDVRQAPFSWSNCFAVSGIKVPELQNRVLERVTPEQYRNRGVLSADSGPPSYFVQLDMFRIRFAPTPNTALSVVGDYLQNIPQIANDDERVDWPRAWDIVLLEGSLYRGYKWRSEQDPTWTRQYRVFRDLLTELKNGENITAREPGKVVLTRSRRGSVIPHDNSADVRWQR